MGEVLGLSVRRDLKKIYNGMGNILMGIRLSAIIFLKARNGVFVSPTNYGGMKEFGIAIP